MALFVAAGITAAVVALALIERVSVGPESRSIRWLHVAAPAALMFLLFVAERIYHAL